MRNNPLPVFLLMMVTLFLSYCTTAEKEHSKNNYKPDSKALYDSIVYLDSVFFTAYDKCDTVTMASLISEDLEFYHDQGGLMTSKDSVMEAIKKNICGKVTRELVPGSIEVYPIAGYGAVEMGEHFFHNNQEPEPKEHSIGKFVQLWKNENGNWRLTRIISLH
jgi:hypothetical protein